MSEKDIHDLDLLLLVKKNPNLGMKKLLSLYGGPISTICRNFLYDCSENDVEEAIADTFIKFWKHSKTFHLDSKHSLKSYLYTIARNTACDKRRKLKKEDIFSYEEISLNLPADFSTESHVIQQETEKILHQCLANMKEPNRSVFLYRYFYGYKQKDIATLLNLSLKKVENILYLGKEKLRKDLCERGISHE